MTEGSRILRQPRTSVRRTPADAQELPGLHITLLGGDEESIDRLREKMTTADQQSVVNGFITGVQTVAKEAR